MPKDRPRAAVKPIPTPKSRLPDAVQLLKRLPSTSLPPQLRRAVPNCAQLSLANYINREYSCSHNGFGCLCTQYSSQGFTLGEFAYLCLEESCGEADKQEAISLYHICGSISGAVRPTHSTLTLPPTTASRQPRPTSSNGVGSPTREPHSTSAPRHSTTFRTTTDPRNSKSKGAQGNPTPTGMGVSPSSASASPSAGALSGAASKPPSSTSLTTGQVVGISIAAVGTVMLLIAAVYLITCLRRRKAKDKEGEDRKSYDFIDEAPPRISPFRYGHADPHGPLSGFENRRVELMSEKHDSKLPNPLLGYESAKPLKKSPDLFSGARRSNDSMRTLSQLLPEKPDSALTKPLPKSPARSTFTATTLFEEEDGTPGSSTKPLPHVTAPGLAITYPPPPPPKALRPQYADELTKSPEQTRLPALSLEIPRQTARRLKIPTVDSFPLPPRSKGPSFKNKQGAKTWPDAPSRDSAGSVMDYYASPDAGYDASPEIDSSNTPVDVEVPKRKPLPNAITVTNPTYPPRPARMSSTGSDTSFESTDPDEPTPPTEEDKQLTPVLESPISGIRYPKVPRSSNQSVPRSPNAKLSPQFARRPDAFPKDDRAVLPSHKKQKYVNGEHAPVTPDRKAANTSSTLSGSTLAAKRIGNSAARDLERRLDLSSSTPVEPNSSNFVSNRSRQESPLKGYGRVASSGRRPSNPSAPVGSGMKSPHWEPKLTPERRGEDLYLSVGVATPQTTAFARS